MTTTPEAPAVDPALLDVLRCPVAVLARDHNDPGRLELHGDCWLICEDSGCKYPIRDGIPAMLVEEGEKWRAVAIEDLPIPPPNRE